MKNILPIFFTVLFCLTCEANEFPDLNGVIDLENTASISDQVFVITMAKSGTHLLLCSISNVTKRPIRTLFPDLSMVTNLLKDDPDFSKPTIYFGHTLDILESCKYNRNKFIATIRDYKENILSRLVLNNRITSLETEKEQIEQLFLDEILQEKFLFKIYMKRLMIFDDFPSEYKYLVRFEDLVCHPENFLPQVLAFIGEEHCNCEEFIKNYDSFKEKLSEKYSLKGIDTGSRSDLNYFKKHISHETLVKADEYIKEHYPVIWERYLKNYEEN